jgi:hypothetical protein
MLQLVGSDELDAFRQYSENANPLLLTLEQKLFFLFTMLEQDGDLLLPLSRALMSQDSEFADWEAGDLLPEILRDAHRKARPSVRSGADIVRLQKLLDDAKAIESWRGKRYRGKGSRDDAATLRLEPMVDLGLLNKNDPFAYRYVLSPAGRSFFGAMSEAGDLWLESIDTRFFSIATRAYELSVQQLSRHLR